MFITIPYTGTIVDTDGLVNVGSILDLRADAYSFDIMADKSNDGSILLSSITGAGNNDELFEGDIRNDLGAPSAMAISTTSSTPQKYIIHVKIKVNGGD